MGRMKILKLLCGFGFLAVLASNIWTIRAGAKAAGSMTTSAICGRRICSRGSVSVASTPTSPSTTIDYLKNKLKAIGFPEWNDVKRVPCHTLIPAADKYVLQYPPGTGLSLALFPAGFQVIPLYVLANVVDPSALRCLR